MKTKAKAVFQLLKRYRRTIEQDNYETSPRTSPLSGGVEEFQLGKTYLNSNDPIDRGVGADILGQFRLAAIKTFLDVSVDLLISALQRQG